MIYRIIFSLTIFSCGYILLSCNKNSSKCKYYTPPYSLILKFTKNEVILKDSILLGIKLRYDDNGTQKYISDFNLSQDSANQNKGLIGTRTIGTLSAESHIKIYYIEYPNSSLSDTLYVDYLPATTATNCLYIENPIKVNGRICKVDSSFHFDSPVYIINTQ